MSYGEVRAAAALPALDGRPTLWTRHFTLTCLAQLFNYSNNTPLYAAFPVFLTSLGYTTETVGLAMAAFSTASFSVRPFVGAAVDRWSPKWVFVAGGLLLAASTTAYLLPVLAVIVLGRVVHGLGWACINTAGSTLVAVASPAARRGEAMGYFAMMPSLASTIMPALGLWLIGTAGVSALFVVSVVLALAAAALASAIHEAPRVPRAAPPAGFWNSLLERGSLLPAGILVTQSTVQPVVITYLVLVANDRGVQNVPLLFIATGLAQIAAQTLSGLSDVLGRAPLIALSLMFGLVGMPLMMVSQDGLLLGAGAVLVAGGSALAYPALMALAIDRTPPENRGAAMATFTAAFQVGNGVGALVLGYAIAWWGFGGMFATAIAVLLVGVVVLALNWQAAGARRLEPLAS